MANSIMAVLVIAALAIVAAFYMGWFNKTPITRAGNELIANGNFEQGNWNGWVELETELPIDQTGTARGVSTISHSGTYSGRLGDGSGSLDNSVTVAQRFTIPSNAKSATLKMWWKMDPSTGGATSSSVSLFVVDLYPDTLPMGRVIATKNVDSLTWKEINSDLSAYIGHSVKMVLITTLKIPILVDDISVQWE